MKIGLADQAKFYGAGVKAHTNTPILARLGLESADSVVESADCITDSVIVRRFSLLNMFNIMNPLVSADRSLA